MAFLVLTNEYCNLNGVDYSSYVKKAELKVDVDTKDVTTMGSAGWTALLAGIKSGTLAIEFQNDFAVGALDAAMWALLGTVVTFEVRPTQAVVGTSNPKYTGSLVVNGWAPITGGVGDDASVSVSYPTTGAVTRGTS